MKKKYSIKEIFHSLQGEGKNAGMPAVFIRFAGCNLNCPFCDTDFSKGELLTAEEILSRCANYGPILPPLVVLTGGEPTLQIDTELIETLKHKFDTVALETNGTRSLPAGLDFVTVSPKDDYNPRELCQIEEANEVKVVFNGRNNVEKYLKICANDYFLQPCDTGNAEQNAQIIQKTINYIKSHPWWRLSLQTQKILKIQ